MAGHQSIDCVLVGWENQENLGLRYIMAFLEAHDWRCALVPFFPDNPREALETVRRLQPRLIGFSIIFQYTVREFAELMRELRRAGVAAHFTAGGHFPSLRPERTLAELPELDSIVRFEGELTALELMRSLDQPARWPSIPGLAYRKGDGLAINPPRPLVKDLDSLPWPARRKTPQTCRGIPTAPLLASRGCVHNCSFCSIRQFYAGASGPLRRVRSPRDVATEMASLYRDSGVRLFLFQDDDFAARTPAQRRWVEGFLGELDAAGLTGRIGWKISCRVDDVEADLMSACRERGLLVVYLGIESGNAAGLLTLQKRVSVEQNLKALQTLKRVGIGYDMGFMLFDPDSSFASVQENLRFLRCVSDIEGPPISFVKMLPLAGTAIQQRLAAEDRLTGDELRPDYRFLDPRLDYYYLFVSLNFSHRNSDPKGLVEHLRQAYFDCLVARSFSLDSNALEYQAALRAIIDRSNRNALDVLEEALGVFGGCPDREAAALRWDELNGLKEQAHHEENESLEELIALLEDHNPSLGRACREPTLHDE